MTFFVMIKNNSKLTFQMSILNYVRDAVSGMSGGFLSNLILHPFDLVRNRLAGKSNIIFEGRVLSEQSRWNHNNL